MSFIGLFVKIFFGVGWCYNVKLLFSYKKDVIGY